MSATTRTIKATPNMGQLAIAFAALLAGTALIVVLAYGQLTSSQGSLAPAAAPAPVTHDHGWSSESVPTTPATHDRGWGTENRGPIVDRNEFDKSHHAVKRRFDLVDRGFGSNQFRFIR